jgi:hypothetical protein
MYGLVNRAVEELVCTHFGEATWEAIRTESGVDIEVFVSMEPYPDEVTYKLVNAASKILGISPEMVLITFGEYWTLYTAREGYGELLKMSGNTCPTFYAISTICTLASGCSTRSCNRHPLNVPMSTTRGCSFITDLTGKAWPP